MESGNNELLTIRLRKMPSIASMIWSLDIRFPHLSAVSQHSQTLDGAAQHRVTVGLACKSLAWKLPFRETTLASTLLRPRESVFLEESKVTLIKNLFKRCCRCFLCLCHSQAFFMRSDGFFPINNFLRIRRLRIWFLTTMIWSGHNVLSWIIGCNTKYGTPEIRSGTEFELHPSPDGKTMSSPGCAFQLPRFGCQAWNSSSLQRFQNRLDARALLPLITICIIIYTW